VNGEDSTENSKEETIQSNLCGSKTLKIGRFCNIVLCVSNNTRVIEFKYIIIET